MPPARRKPPAGPGRRPRVAGRTSLNKPEAVDKPEVTDEPEATDKPEVTDKPEQPVAKGPSLSKPASAAKPKPEPESKSKSESEPTAEPGPASTPEPAEPKAPYPPIVRKSALVVAVVAVILAIVGAVASFTPGTSDPDNTAWVDESATSEVTAGATTALQTVFSYKFDTIDDDQANARRYLDGERLDEYNATADQTKDSVLQTKTVTTATVTDIGVSNLQDDRAEVVVSMEIAANQDGVDQGIVQTPVTVSMKKVDGTWLITEIDNR